jgi:hypothetical protein
MASLSVSAMAALQTSTPISWRIDPSQTLASEENSPELRIIVYIHLSYRTVLLSLRGDNAFASELACLCIGII